MIVYSAFSDAGLVCKENQDSIFCKVSGEKGLFLVADGMGGHEDGLRASSTIKNLARSWWDSGTFFSKDFWGTVESLKQMLSDANSQIFTSTSEGLLCGSTVVLMWMDGGGYALITSGDSRCYRMAQNHTSGYADIDIISTDDVWENNMNNIRGLSEEEITGNVNYGRLSRAVGTSADFSCTVRCDSIDRPTVFALCSDGIYKYADDQVLYSEFEKAAETGELEESCRRIRKNVYDAGAPDNLSLILLSTGNNK